jgi:cell division protein FtsL
MTNEQVIYLSLISVLLLFSFACLWYAWDLSKELTKCRSNLNAETLSREHYLQKWRAHAQDPIAGVPAYVVERVTALENENAGLRVDNETGIRLIQKQNQVVTDLKKQIQRLTGENRRLNPGKKR